MRTVRRQRAGVRKPTGRIQQRSSAISSFMRKKKERFFLVPSSCIQSYLNLLSDFSLCSCFQWQRKQTSYNGTFKREDGPV